MASSPDQNDPVDDDEPVRNPFADLVEEARFARAGGGGIHIPLFWSLLMYLAVLAVLGGLAWWIWVS